MLEEKKERRVIESIFEALAEGAIRVHWSLVIGHRCMMRWLRPCIFTLDARCLPLNNRLRAQGPRLKSQTQFETLILTDFHSI